MRGSCQPLLAGHSLSSSSTEEEQADDDLEEEEDLDLFLVYDGAVHPAVSAVPHVRRAGRPFRSTSFGMPVDHPIREWCVLTMCDKRLDNAALLIIMLNSMYMLFEPPILEPGSLAEKRSTAVEWACMIFFTAEMLIKMVAQGFARHEGAFLHDPWNLLDVIVVAPFWAKIMIPSMPSFAMLRLVRALRPLRAIRKFPELRRTVEAFLQAVPALSTVAALTIFFFLVFGVVGVEMYEGSFHYRCAAPGVETAAVAAKRLLRGGGGGGHDGEGEDVVFCSPGNSATCAAGEQCTYFEANPPATVTYGNFDTIRDAFVVLLQATTFNDWTVPMFAATQARPELASFTYGYFNFVTLIGGFFIFNLFVAVIFDEVIRSVEHIKVMEYAESYKGGGSFKGGGSALQDQRPPSPPPAPPQQAADNDSSPAARESNDCCGFEHALRPVGYVTALVITGNIAMMCVPYRGMSAEMEHSMQLISYGCTAYFVCEALLKIMVYGQGNLRFGWERYWNTREDATWNRLDFFVIAVDLGSTALEELLMSVGGGKTNASTFRILRVFRALRVLRAFKLSNVWGPLNDTLHTMYNGSAPVASLAVLILLFCIMFALLGKELFGGLGLADKTRWHFDSAVPALITVMTIFSGEWAEFLYDATVSLETTGISPSTVTMFTVGALFLGHFVVVNLFVAVLVEAFVADQGKRRQQEARARAGRKVLAEPAGALGEPVQKEDDDGTGIERLELVGVTCGCIGETNGMRRFCRAVLMHEAWNVFIVILILASCVSLAYDDPRLEPTSNVAKQLDLANVTLTVLFGLEAVLKILVSGFVWERASYLRSGWNCLDFFILCTSLVTLLPGGVDVSSVRLLRVLRPLRLVRRVPGMAVIFRFFGQAMGEMANVAGVVIFFQLIFAVMGLQLFLDIDFEYPELSFNSFTPAMLFLFVAATGDAWTDVMWSAMDAGTAEEASKRNDQSAASLYFIAWIYVGQFVMVNFFVATVVNHFVRIKEEESGATGTDGNTLLTKEQRQWQAAAQTALQHERQRPQDRLLPPDGALRQWVHGLVTSKPFEYFMTLVVLFNIIVMSLNYYHIERDRGMLHLYHDLMWLCTRIYYLECFLKLVGLSVSGYFSDAWNRFDFFLVAAAAADEFATELIHEYLPLPPMLLRVLRLARVLRAVRLLRQFKALRNVVMTLFLSFPSFLNVASLLALVIFTYAVLGVQLFAFVGPGTLLQEPRTFSSVGAAMEVLLQCLTGDGWAILMIDAINPPERGTCDPNMLPQTNCGSSVAYPYFISFVFISTLVLANLVVAIILQNFSLLGDLNPSVASKDDIENFNEAWHQFDMDGSGFLAAESLPELLMTLKRPLRPLGVPASGDGKPDAVLREKARNMVASLVRNGYLPAKLLVGYIEYRFTLTALINFSYEHYNRIQEDEACVIETPPILNSTLRAQLRGWAKIRNVLRNQNGIARLQLAYTDITNARAGLLTRVLLEDGKLGRGTHTEQLRVMTELVKIMAGKFDGIEEGVLESRACLEDIKSVLTESQRELIDAKFKERQQERQIQAAAAKINEIARKYVIAADNRRKLKSKRVSKEGHDTRVAAAAAKTKGAAREPPSTRDGGSGSPVASRPVKEIRSSVPSDHPALPIPARLPSPPNGAAGAHVSTMVSLAHTTPPRGDGARSPKHSPKRLPRDRIDFLSSTSTPTSTTASVSKRIDLSRPSRSEAQGTTTQLAPVTLKPVSQPPSAKIAPSSQWPLPSTYFRDQDKIVRLHKTTAPEAADKAAAAAAARGATAGGTPAPTPTPPRVPAINTALPLQSPSCVPSLAVSVLPVPAADAADYDA